jgi:cell division protein FtsQ
LKTLVKILLMLFIGAYLIVVLGFAGRQYEAVLCRDMQVVVRDSLERGLVTASDIRNLIRLEHPEVVGLPVARVNEGSIEESLVRLPAISTAQVYTNIKGRLIVEITQRVPVARIEDRDHNRYYLDEEGYVIPANMEYTPHLLCINGEIPGRYSKEKNIHPVEGTEGSGICMEDLLKLAMYINADPFWRSQIVQVYVNGSGEFELIPRVGSQIIFFGTAERMETKFFNLKTLYRDGFSHTGWNQYETINLKYNNQVICTKR